MALEQYHSSFRLLLSAWRPRFNPRSVHVRSVVDNRLFSQYFIIPI